MNSPFQTGEIQNGTAKRGLALVASNIRIPQILALVYIVGATIFAVLAFRNFSIIDVAATMLLFSALPLGMILFTTAGAGEHTFRQWRRALLVIVVAPVMFFIQFWGLSRWAGYVANFPNHRIEASESGFHPDSAFHVAIIQGILNTGYPTTGQHLEPWVSYHALSHYVDAIALFVLGLDAWESYALLFFAKGIAISLAVIYFSMKVADGRLHAVFWLTLLIVYPAFTATWHVIGSHGQWFPMILLALSAHRVFLLAMKDSRSWSDYLYLTALVITFSLGKVSIGFGFAVLVGFFLLFRRPIDWRLLVTGLFWAGFLAIYSTIYSTYSAMASAGLDTSALWDLFQFAWRDISALALIAVFIGVISRVTKTMHGQQLFSALVASVVTTAITVIMATNNKNDVFYFFHGLFSAALFLSVVFVARALFPSSDRQETRTPLQPYLFKLLAFASAFLFVVSPVTRVALVSPYSSPEAIWAIGTTVSNHTYQWSNEEAGPGERLTAWKALRGKSLRVEEDYQRPWPSQFRDTVHDFLDSENLSDESPLLFLTSEQFESVSQRMSGPLWATGLAVTAVTGMPLVHGVPDPPRNGYGFGDYNEDAHLLPQVSVSEDKLCDYGRPIISVTDIDDVAFKVLCR